MPEMMNIMNETLLRRALKIASHKFFSMSEEEHRKIRNDSRYDDLFYNLDYFNFDDDFYLTSSSKRVNKIIRRKATRIATELRSKTTSYHQKTKNFYETLLT